MPNLTLSVQPLTYPLQLIYILGGGGNNLLLLLKLLLFMLGKSQYTFYSRSTPLYCSVRAGMSAYILLVIVFCLEHSRDIADSRLPGNTISPIML